MKQIFPKWTNKIGLYIIIIKFLLVLFIGISLYFFGSDDFLSVGYKPEQPIPFSHKLHAGNLKIDCRYCHYTVEKSAIASVPPSQTCMNCHSKVKTNSPKLAPLQKVHQEFINIEVDGKEIKVKNPDYNKTIEWKRVHNIPDYAFFDHSIHVKGANISCVSCHGRVDQMEEVKQIHSLSMGWCLKCHDNPEKHIYPDGVPITNLSWPNNKKEKEIQKQFSKELRENRLKWMKKIEELHKEKNNTKKEEIKKIINKLNEKNFFKPPRECSACHY